MVKLRLNPGRTAASGSPSRRSSRTQKEWNVKIFGVEESSVAREGWLQEYLGAGHVAVTKTLQEAIATR